MTDYVRAPARALSAAARRHYGWPMSSSTEGTPAHTFSLEEIRPVRDPMARRALEHAQAFVEGVTQVVREAETDDAVAHLREELAAIGIGASEAERVAGEARELIELMADRDRKADVFHAAVRAAGQSERAMVERLAALTRQLRIRLGATAPELALFGVPPDVPDEAKPRSKPTSTPGPLWSAATPK
jgi:hypothetical protein